MLKQIEKPENTPVCVGGATLMTFDFVMRFINCIQ